MTEAVQISSIQVAVIGLLFTAAAALWAVYRLINAGPEAVRKELIAEIEKQAALSSKSIHDKANAFQTVTTKLEVDIERLKRETVRREDMAAIEQRLTTMFVKMETKVDTIVDKLAGFAVLERQVQALTNRLEIAVRPDRP